MTDHGADVHRQYLALLLAVLDHDDHRAHAITSGADVHELAHYAAHKMVVSIDAEDHPEMRADIEAELLALDGRATRDEC